MSEATDSGTVKASAWPLKSPGQLPNLSEFLRLGNRDVSDTDPTGLLCDDF